jgi:hypothetical protein
VIPGDVVLHETAVLEWPPSREKGEMARSTANRHGGRGGSWGSGFDGVGNDALGSDGGEEGGTADEGQGDAMRLVCFANAVRARSGQDVEAGQGDSASGEEGEARGGSGGVGAVGVDLAVEGETRRGITERMQEAEGSKILVRLAVTEFGSDADARYASLTVAIAKQMLDIGVKDLDDPRFVLTTGEVVRWQSPFG